MLLPLVVAAAVAADAYRRRMKGDEDERRAIECEDASRVARAVRARDAIWLMAAAGGSFPGLWLRSGKVGLRLVVQCTPSSL